MKAKIIKCSDSMYWYRDMIGKVILIERETPDYYWAREQGVFNCLNIIQKSDVEIIKEIKE